MLQELRRFHYRRSLVAPLNKIAHDYRFSRHHGQAVKSIRCQMADGEHSVSADITHLSCGRIEMWHQR